MGWGKEEGLTRAARLVAWTAAVAEAAETGGVVSWLSRGDGKRWIWMNGCMDGDCMCDCYGSQKKVNGSDGFTEVVSRDKKDYTDG